MTELELDQRAIEWLRGDAGLGGVVYLLGSERKHLDERADDEADFELAEMLAGAVVFLFLAVNLFRLGLRRYESGSAIQVEV